MKLFPAAAVIARKDLREYLRDRTAVLLGFALPVGLIAVFGLVMGSIGGGSGGMPKVPLWVVDLDGSAESGELLESLREGTMIRVRTPDPDEVEETLSIVADGQASHLLVIEEGFADAEPPGGLLLVRDPGRSMEDQVVRIALGQSLMGVGRGGGWDGRLRDLFEGMGMAGPALETFTGQSREMNETIETWFEENPAEDEVEINPLDFMTGGADIPIEDVVPPDRPKNTTYQIAQSVSGTSVMMLMFGLATCATTLLVEREEGTLARLLSSAAPRGAILLGKGLFVAAVGAMQLAVMFVCGELLFGVGTFRDPVSLLVVSAVWLATATALGMLIAAASRTRKQAESWSPVIVLPLAALGGCWFPLQLANLPSLVEMATKATPTYWAMLGYQGYFWRAEHWTSPQTLSALGVQLAYAAAMAAAAAWFFRRNTLRG